MPYIRIKAYPKDQATKEKVVEAINKAFVDNWGCAPEAISISIEEVAPDNWVDQVEKARSLMKDYDSAAEKEETVKKPKVRIPYLIVLVVFVVAVVLAIAMS